MNENSVKISREREIFFNRLWIKIVFFLSKKKRDKSAKRNETDHHMDGATVVGERFVIASHDNMKRTEKSTMVAVASGRVMEVVFFLFSFISSLVIPQTAGGWSGTKSIEGENRVDSPQYVGENDLGTTYYLYKVKPYIITKYSTSKQILRGSKKKVAFEWISFFRFRFQT